MKFPFSTSLNKGKVVPFYRQNSFLIVFNDKKMKNIEKYPTVIYNNKNFSKQYNNITR